MSALCNWKWLVLSAASKAAYANQLERAANAWQFQASARLQHRTLGSFFIRCDG